MMKRRTYVFVLLVYATLASGIILTGCSKFPSNVFKGKSGDRSSSNSPALSQEKLQNLYFASKPEMVGDIAHYEFDVRVGPGQYDVVRLHRVIRVKKNFQPYPTKGNIIMMHGSLQDFGDIFYNAGVDKPTPQTSVALYLASKGIDVWGINLAWTLVPEETTDFTFMKDWGVERDVDHVLAAMSDIRRIRGITGQGTGRMNLLGFSYSVDIAYGAAGRETQLSPDQRSISAIIPVDYGIKVQDETLRQNACTEAADLLAQIGAGDYQTSSDGLRMFNQLATSDPDGPSPIFTGYTNYQAILLLSNQGFWHFVGVDFNAGGTPVGLLYSDPQRWINVVGGSPPNVAYEPRLQDVEEDESWCGETDVSFDDHLADITVPILFIGAAGGIGELGVLSTKLTSSKDITTYIVSMQSEANRDIDFGHGDLFIARDAPKLVWKKIYEWVKKHDSPSPSNHNEIFGRR